MSEELKAALARIACLEGEIAKRDETIARPEPQLNRAIQANYDLREELAACRVAVENCEVFRARIAELEARIVELESAAESLRISRDYHHEQENEYRRRWAGVTTGAHSLIIPERDAVIRKAVGMCNRIPGSTTWNAAEFAYDELAARLNAAPVHQVSVPDGWKHGLPPEGEICEARIPHHAADGRQMIWCEVEVIAHSIINGAIYSWVKETGRDGSFYAPMILSFRKLAAAQAAPAADACKACKGTGRRPIGGRGRIFGLTNRCFECQPLTAEEVYGDGDTHDQ